MSRKTLAPVETVRALYTQGLTNEEMALKLNVSIHTIVNVRRQHKITARPYKVKVNISEQYTEAEIFSLFKEAKDKQAFISVIHHFVPDYAKAEEIKRKLEV